MHKSLAPFLVLLLGGKVYSQCSVNPSGTQTIDLSALGCCAGLSFYDNGGSAGNYGNNRRDTVYFVNPGGRLQVSFSSFSTEAGPDVLSIYDGLGPNAPLVGQYSGTVVPPPFVSSTDTVTMIFYSDGSTVYAGWGATVGCVSGLTRYALGSGSPMFTLPCGDFYSFTDDGGTAGFYSEGIDDTVTFSPSDASQYLVAAFPYQVDLGAGDTLWVYAGSVSGGALLAVFTQGSSRADTVVAPQAGQPLIFRFKSNTDGSRGRGWGARIYCAATAPQPVSYMGAGVRYVGCGALPYRLYDSGSPGLLAGGRTAYGNYANNEMRVLTFASAGLASPVQVRFTAFTTESGVDWLEAYDGANTAAPLIGRWSGANTPPVIESTGPYLTVRFSSDGTTNYSGWVAQVNCTGRPIPPIYRMVQPTQTESVCEALFYDDGGPEGDYTSPQTRTFTFCPPSADSYLVVRFPYDFLLARGDTLWVYEGPSSTPQAELLGIYTLRNEGEQIATTRPGWCLTFHFRAASTLGQRRGWAGLVRCTASPDTSITYMGHGLRRMCNLRFYDSGRPYRIGDNGRGGYGNYANNERDTLLLLSPGGCGGVQVQFTDFTTETCCDLLRLYNGGTTASSLLGSYSGSSLPNSGNPIVSGGDSLLVVWYSDGTTNYRGWAAQVSCSGRPQALVNGAPAGSLCGRDSVALTASPSGAGYTYLWNTGATTPSIWVRYPGGTYYVAVTSPSGCVAVSPSVQVFFYAPLDTSVQVSGSGVGTTTLTAQGCSSGLTCTWINCSSRQAVGSGATFMPSQAGEYAVVLYDPNTGCRDTSACYLVDVAARLAAEEAGVRLWPNPSTGRAWLAASVPLVRVEVWNLEGRRVLWREGPLYQAELAVPEVGLYLVQLYTLDGSCQTLRWQVSR